MEPKKFNGEKDRRVRGGSDEVGDEDRANAGDDGRLFTYKKD